MQTVACSLTTMVIDCPMCFRHTYVYPGGGKKKMQLRVANHIPLVRKNDSFTTPG